MTDINQMIETMQHFADGGEIEVFNYTEWCRCTHPEWDWSDHIYRIKPKAKRKIKLEAWLSPTGEMRYFKTEPAISSNCIRLPALDLETEID